MDVIIAISYLAGIAAGSIAGATHAGSGVSGFASEMLRWVFLIAVGVPLLIAFVGHTFRGEVSARRLGWPTGNPFQTEVGIWDGAGGAIAVVAFWRHDGFWLATVIAHSLFWTGAGIVHVREIVKERNFRADNLLPAVVNFLVPATLISLYALAS
jgi:hypothetical protein